MEPAVTRHAQARMQQRGIRPDAVEYLLEYGREALSSDGEVLTVGHRYRRINKG